jgi:hypothetical protein
MKDPMPEDSTSKRLPNWVANLGLVLGGIALAVALAQGLIVLFPGLLPSFLRLDPYDRRVRRADDLDANFLTGKGDLFVSQPGSVAPPDDPDELLASFSMSFDEEGFRRPFVEADSYPIIALGDSYTEGVHVPKPWPDVLASELQTPVRNLGFQGYGPHDYVEVMRIYGTTEPHQWVVLAFFEGNDPSALVSDESEGGFTLPNLTRQAFLAARGSYTTPDFGEGPWKYPVTMELGGQSRPLNLFEFHLWWVNGELADYRASRNMAVLGDLLADVKAQAGDACLLVAHVPTKEHIYFPYVSQADGSVDTVLESSWAIELDEQDRLTVAPTPTSRDALVARLDNMGTVVGEVARAAGAHFIDLSGPLKEAAARGEESYYLYDTHWNQHGHDIAGAAIADYIRQHPECGL